MKPIRNRVIFRFWRDSQDVIALFPDMKEHGYLINSYMHVGQHGAANYAHVVEASRLATPAEYEPLARELTAIGYVLDVRTRNNRRRTT